jgi:hypothetical protein
MRLAVTVIAWVLLAVGLAGHAAAGDWWELGLLAVVGALFIVGVWIRVGVRRGR